MPEDDKSAPVRRGPGRPRKVQETEPAQPELKVERPSDPDDSRIGQECPVGWSNVGYGDGTTYRCEDGVIVERVYF